MKLPSYLTIALRNRKRIIASGILTRKLSRCCNIGCVKCYFIGWTHTSNDEIIDIAPKIHSVAEIAKRGDVSTKTIQRSCDAGCYSSFKVPGSNIRYIVIPEDY